MKKLGFTLLALITSSCSIMVKTPMNRFESPEARGKSAGISGFAAYQGRSEVELTNDFTTTPPSLSSPSVKAPGHRLMANGSIGLGERFDINITLPETRLGAKFQILGDPLEKAEAGNIPLAINGGVSAVSEKETRTSSSQSFEMKEIVMDLGLATGYRFNKDVLLYGGPFVLWDKLHSIYTPSAGTSVDARKTMRVYGVNVGVELGFGNSNGFARLEGAGTQTQLGGTKVGRATYGAAVGARF